MQVPLLLLLLLLSAFAVFAAYAVSCPPFCTPLPLLGCCCCCLLFPLSEGGSLVHASDLPAVVSYLLLFWPSLHFESWLLLLPSTIVPTPYKRPAGSMMRGNDHYIVIQQTEGTRPLLTTCVPSTYVCAHTPTAHHAQRVFWSFISRTQAPVRLLLVCMHNVGLLLML